MVVDLKHLLAVALLILGVVCLYFAGKILIVAGGGYVAIWRRWKKLRARRDRMMR